MEPQVDDFTRVYDRHVDQVFGFLAYRVIARDDAEDLTQLTFERALRAWSRYDPARAQPATWLLAIARNTLIDHYRASGRRRYLTLDEMGEHEPVAGPAEFDLGVSSEILQALATLTERDREIVALRYGADLTGPEIAHVTGLSLGNVQQILSRSLRKMRGVLEEDV
jgi:RNA polymerase sigma factor (sigma-70 family)